MTKRRWRSPEKKEAWPVTANPKFKTIAFCFVLIVGSLVNMTGPRCLELRLARLVIKLRK